MIQDVQFTSNLELIETANKNRKVQINKTYQHFKGGLYIVEDIARHSETQMEMVVYRSLKTGELWVRPVEMFLDIKQTDQGYAFRFTQYFL